MTLSVDRYPPVSTINACSTTRTPHQLAPKKMRRKSAAFFDQDTRHPLRHRYRSVCRCEECLQAAVFASTINRTEIAFDPAKDASNIRKHGVSLVLASEIDWSEVMARPDNRRDYFELREIDYTVIHDHLYCVVFTQRGETMHIISLRKANRREVRDVQES
jgi:uncharacterized protein